MRERDNTEGGGGGSVASGGRCTPAGQSINQPSASNPPRPPSLIPALCSSPRQAMQERVLGPQSHPRVTVHLNTQIIDAVADDQGRMSALRLRDAVSGQERDPLPVRGLFYGIGHKPK